MQDASCEPTSGIARMGQFWSLVFCIALELTAGRGRRRSDVCSSHPDRIHRLPTSVSGPTWGAGQAVGVHPSSATRPPQAKPDCQKRNEAQSGHDGREDHEAPMHWLRRNYAVGWTHIEVNPRSDAPHDVDCYANRMEHDGRSRRRRGRRRCSDRPDLHHPSAVRKTARSTMNSATSSPVTHQTFVARWPRIIMAIVRPRRIQMPRAVAAA